MTMSTGITIILFIAVSISMYQLGKHVGYEEGWEDSITNLDEFLTKLKIDGYILEKDERKEP